MRELLHNLSYMQNTELNAQNGNIAGYSVEKFINCHTRNTETNAYQ